MDVKRILDTIIGYVCIAIVYISLFVWCVGVPVALVIWNLKHFLK